MTENSPIHHALAHYAIDWNDGQMKIFPGEKRVSSSFSDGSYSPAV
jgi:hypothetical protein